jgi:DNA-binding NtrC family response regulator
MSEANASGLPPSAEGLPPGPVIFGHSEPMRVVQQKVEKVASVNIPVLIQGESGTGKEIIARLIHQLSPWHSGPSRSTVPPFPEP